jgi:hypothetical protein
MDHGPGANPTAATDIEPPQARRRIKPVEEDLACKQTPWTIHTHRHLRSGSVVLPLAALPSSAHNDVPSTKTCRGKRIGYVKGTIADRIDLNWLAVVPTIPLGGGVERRRVISAGARTRSRPATTASAVLPLRDKGSTCTGSLARPPQPSPARKIWAISLPTNLDSSPGAVEPFARSIRPPRNQRARMPRARASARKGGSACRGLLPKITGMRPRRQNGRQGWRPKVCAYQTCPGQGDPDRARSP